MWEWLTSVNVLSKNIQTIENRKYLRTFLGFVEKFYGIFFFAFHPKSHNSDWLISHKSDKKYLKRHVVFTLCCFYVAGVCRTKGAFKSCYLQRCRYHFFLPYWTSADTFAVLTATKLNLIVFHIMTFKFWLMTTNYIPKLISTYLNDVNTCQECCLLHLVHFFLVVVVVGGLKLNGFSHMCGLLCADRNQLLHQTAASFFGSRSVNNCIWVYFTF